MIGEGYGYMKELADVMGQAQVAIVSSRLDGENQVGEFKGTETSLKLSLR